MKLLLYSHFFAPSIGGVESVVLSLARGLAQVRDEKGAAEFDVRVATQTSGDGYDDNALPFQVIRRPRLGQLLQLVRDADVVHVAGPALAPLFLAIFARKPLVIEHHGYQATCPNGLLFHHPSGAVCGGHFEAGNYLECLNCNDRIERWSGSLRLLLAAFARRALSRQAAANIAPTQHVAARQNLPRTTVILHGVKDPARGNWKAAATETNEGGGFAYLGRLVVEKGVSVLLEAARLLQAKGREVHVTVIGDGPDRPRLESQVRASGLEHSVRFTGFLSGESLERELGKASAVVVPTMMEEPAGLAALEPMARGRPVIASATGGLKEIVNGAGLTVAPNDAAALAEAMRRILDDPALAASLGAMARERALRSFSFGGMIDAHACVYRAVHAAGNR